MLPAQPHQIACYGLEVHLSDGEQKQYFYAAVASAPNLPLKRAFTTPGTRER